MDNAVLGKRIRESRFAQKLIIEKKALRGEDGHKSFTIRITDETAEELNKLSRESNRTRNELIGIFLEYAIKHCEIGENE
ncbi:MAG: ribbon-helix-helix protein, CopG family [Ruminococcaceae bacterium]|nr:ribbon-helix-helix protein, CopG family [Oscillospiraceae bacterium]